MSKRCMYAWIHEQLLTSFWIHLHGLGAILTRETTLTEQYLLLCLATLFWRVSTLTGSPYLLSSKFFPLTRVPYEKGGIFSKIIPLGGVPIHLICETNSCLNETRLVCIQDSSPDCALPMDHIKKRWHKILTFC